MISQHDGKFHGLVSLLGFFIDLTEVFPRGHVDSELVWAFHHQAIVAAIVDPGVWVFGHYDASAEIGANVRVVVNHLWEALDVHILAHIHYLVHRAIARHLGLDGMVQGLQVLIRQLVFTDTYTGRHKRTRGAGVDDQRELASFDLLEEKDGRAFLHLQFGHDGRRFVGRRNFLIYLDVFIRKPCLYFLKKSAKIIT